MSSNYRANPRVKLKKTNSKDVYSGTPASYDVFVDGVLVGRLRGTYSRIMGVGQHFEGKDGSRNGFSGVRGVYRKHLDRAAIDAFETLTEKAQDPTEE